jgi:IS5 family transposase
MRQQSFATLAEGRQKRTTRKAQLLKRMETLVPWSELQSVIEPYYPKGKRGRPPIGLDRMLRMYFLQQWFSLSDEGVEDALYDMPLFRDFVGVDLWEESAPDATTLLNFRRLLERHDLTRQMFEHINGLLEAEGLLMREGTMVDATIIDAPSSTKNADNARDPEMHQSKKGNQWYFGMKAHIGADIQSGLVHSLQTTAANAADVTQTEHLLHGQEKSLWADAGYVSADKRKGLKEKDLTWRIAERRSQVKKLEEGSELRRLVEEAETLKAKVRSRVEHAFHILKNLFGHRKARYKGLAKNEAQLFSLFALGNLVMAERLRAKCAQGAS